jgi:AraC-like DNA-binding protein
MSNISKFEFEIKRILFRFNKTIANTHAENNRDSSSLIYYVNGGHSFDFGDYHIQGGEGNMIYIPCGSSYINHLTASKTEYYQIDFNFLKDGKPYPLWDRLIVFDQKESLRYFPIFKEFYEIYAMHDVGYDMFCSSKTLMMIGMIKKGGKYIETTSNSIRKIEKTVQYLREFYYLDSSVDELAALSSLSVSGLEKHFKECFGMSPLSYRNTIRIERAKLLLEGGFSIAETSNKVGFSDIYYFSKVFKNICGITPGKYSKENCFFN